MSKTKTTYAARNPHNRCWSSVMGYDDAKRRELFSPKQNNLPPDAFADEAEVTDDVGIYYTRMTEVEGGWSSLGEYEKTNKES